MATFSLSAAMRKVRALLPGECVAFVLIDPANVIAQERAGAVDPTGFKPVAAYIQDGWGTRIVVNRNLGHHDDTFRVELQETNSSGQWDAYNHTDGAAATYFTDQWFVALDDAPSVIGFFAFEAQEQLDRLLSVIEDERAPTKETVSA